ncbi:MAG: DEAD/DEAH box helicase [Anaerolineaceae bacterium]|nr:DEAD/DEAH box helicase [Anaerolineaceae bacterium]
MAQINEDTVEYVAIDWLREIGYDYVHGGEIAPGEPAAERDDYREVLLLGRLRRSLAGINGHLPRAVRADVIEDVIRKIERPISQKIEQNNHAFHQWLVEGVDVSFHHEGSVRHDKVWLVDFDDPQNNDWLVVNQFTVMDINHRSGAKTNRRPDLVLFVNGIPLTIFEFKDAKNEKADIRAAFNQCQTYKTDIGSIFTFNELLVISDGLEARLGTLTSGWEWFRQWRTVDGIQLDPYQLELETLIKGVFQPEIFLDLIRNFIVFEIDGSKYAKKVAAYHQYHAVNKALDRTLYATGIHGDQRVGVVWHTQGSGKSLSMLFYAGKVIQHPQMANPTLIILTDRNDLDDQLFGTFSTGQELLRQEPVQAGSRQHLQDLLQVAAGGVVFTTIQKFRPEEDMIDYPLLSDRRNIVFIADEAHRSQYGFDAKLTQRGDEARISYGFAKYVRDALPNASFIGFTGTPVETTDANTKQVFGDYIDIYDIQRAVDDGATVPIYYQGRLAELQLRDAMRGQLDPEFNEITESQEDEVRESLKTKWAALEAMVGTEERLKQVANDIVEHFEERLDILDGKGMIVTMSRRIAVDLYEQIIKLRPEWHSDRDENGAIKVIMTGSASDPGYYQPHIRNKPRRKALADRFKDADDSLKLVIVRDMWLTGFDAPPLHTMYVDKPMHSHGLMQAIARVNRVFRDKPGGLVVDYLGIAPDLQEAVQQYTQQGSGKPAFDQSEAIKVMLTRYEDIKRMFGIFDHSAFKDSSLPPADRLRLIPSAMEHILSLPFNGKEPKQRYLEHVSALAKAFALSVPAEEAMRIRDDLAFFQAVQSAFRKATPTDDRPMIEDIEPAIKQLVSKAVASDNVIDIFKAAGIASPNIAVLSDDFLNEVAHLPQKNLALEMLRKLLNDEIRARSRTNAVQARSFAAMIEQTIRRYQNRSIDAAETILELINLAKGLKKANQRGEDLGLSDNELAFYDALAESKSAVEVMGDKELAVIAMELVKSVRANTTIDWTVKESARAKMRVLVKRILRKFGYPPDLRDKATQTVLEQAELLAVYWSGDSVE